MSANRWPSLGAVVLLLLALAVTAGCAPVAGEPAAGETAAASPEALAAAPGAPTVTPPPYPWPTPPPGPTGAPQQTEEPTATPALDPTTPPTPVVTPIPTAAPPLIPFPEGTTPQPFSLYWREGDVIRTMRSDEAKPQLFLDPAAEFGLFLPPLEAGFRTWGAVSPDGRTMVLVLAEEPQPPFVENEPYPVHLYLLDRETHDLRLLAKNGLEPVWSPDSKRIAYRSTVTGGLWVAEVEDEAVAEVYKVDRAGEHLATQYSWAWDSRRLVFVDEVPFQSTTLVIVDANQLEAPFLLVESPYFVGRPQWSPVSDTITFTWSAGEDGRGPHIWVSSADGSERQQLTSRIRALSGLPLWSADGNWIAFSGLAEYESEAPQYDLWLVSSHGHELRRICVERVNSDTAGEVHQSMPLLSPDGTQILFAQGTSAVKVLELWVLSLIDGSKRQLSSIEDLSDRGVTVGSKPGRSQMP